MATLYPYKLVNVITSGVLQDKLIEIFRRHGVSGYTIIQVTGEGASSSALDFEATVMVKVIAPVEKLQRLLDALQRLIDKGYHLTIFVSDVDVITPEKFSKELK